MEILQPERYYHIYNRAVGNESLFRSGENYDFFLKKYHKFINPIAKTYAYCLMPNHFHFQISIREEEILKFHFEQKYGNSLTFQKFQTSGKLTEKLHTFISKEFSNLFSSYAQAFNKQQRRTGNLFTQNFKRKEIISDEYLKKLTHYIHYNPVAHGYVEKIEEWQYSSYNSMLLEKPTAIMRKEVIEWFDDKKNFVFYHQMESDLISF